MVKNLLKMFICALLIGSVAVACGENGNTDDNGNNQEQPENPGDGDGDGDDLGVGGAFRLMVEDEQSLILGAEGESVRLASDGDVAHQADTLEVDLADGA